MSALRKVGLAMTLIAAPMLTRAENFTITSSKGLWGTFDAPVEGGDVTAVSLTRKGVTYQHIAAPMQASFNRSAWVRSVATRTDAPG